MKKIISLVLAAVMSVGLFTGCADNYLSDFKEDVKKDLGISTNGKDSDGKYSIELDVLVENNVVFSTYSVDVIVDGEKITTLNESGSPEMIDLKLEEGSHTFRFEKNGDSSVFAETTEQINEEKTLQYGLKRHNSDIDLTPMIRVDLNLKMKTNVAFSKYNVDFSIDLIPYTTLTNSDKEKSFVLLMDKGTHYFNFYNSDDYSICGEFVETISENTTLDLEIKRKKDKITVK